MSEGVRVSARSDRDFQLNRSNRQPSLLPLALLAAAATALGGWVSYKEGVPFFVERQDGRFVSLENATAEPGLATASWQEVLIECARSLRSLTHEAASTAGVVPLCREIATDIVASAPTSALGWYVGAAAAAAAQDWSAFNKDLQASYLTAKSEMWVARWRVPLAERNFAQLEPAVLALHEDDLRLMVGSWMGVRVVAAFYAANPAFRERITAIVETMTAEDQSRFLSSLRVRAN